MVWKLDRLGHSPPYHLDIIADFRERGIAFRSLIEHMGYQSSKAAIWSSDDGPRSMRENSR